jgi:TRAP-type mannitol/chloroaromatic compound transport system permease large subunit
VSLPENAYRELRPGEAYEPLVPSSAAAPEVTRRSIAFGLVMTTIFSAAAAYISLKLGQGIESAIPIAILAIGFSAIARRKSTLLENVNIVTLGACAGIVVGGSTFTMPAIFILVGSTVFSLTFRGVNGDLWVEHLLTGLPGGPIGFLIVVNALVFVLAFFLDFFELAFIIVPLLAPVADKLGIDLIWFGVLLGVNMQTSFMHPPFGFALFYLRSVAPAKAYLDKITGKLIAPITTGQIYWGAVPFVVIQVIMVGIVITFPHLVTGVLHKSTVDPSKIEINIPASDYGRDQERERTPPDFGTPKQDVSPGHPRRQERSGADEGGDLEKLFKQQGK